MSWWDKHYRDPAPDRNCRNLCARCRKGYPVDQLDGPYYCDKHGTTADEVTECADYERRWDRVSLNAEEIRQAHADYNPTDTDKTCGECHRFTTEPRLSPKPWCCACYGPDEIEPDRKACKEYWDRAEQERQELEEAQKREMERQEKWVKNRDNPPRPAVFKRDIDYITGKPTGEMPYCPNCEELLYNLDRCYFCGQAILEDDHMREWNKPPETIQMDCISCKGKGTVTAVISSYNGHRHGRCSACGASFIE